MMMRILEGGNEEMFHLVIDLEMCKVPRDYRSKSYRYAYEIIQIGAVLLDDSFKRIGTLCQYVHPEHGVIDYFIENLTGIKNSQVKKAPKLEEVLIHMIDWLGERDYKIYAWQAPLCGIFYLRSVAVARYAALIRINDYK